MTSFKYIAIIAPVLFLTVSSGHAEPRFDKDAIYRVPIGDSPSLGPSDALVTIVEFSDFYCPNCRHAAETMAEIRRLYPDEVRFVYRHSLLDPEDGTLAAEATIAARDQGMFWPMHDRIFFGGERITKRTLERYAEELGLDAARFRRTLDSRETLEDLVSDLRTSVELGVRGVPIFFINGRPVSGAYPLGAFLPIIERELARAEKLVAAGTPAAEVYDALTKHGERRARDLPDGADRLAVPSIEPGVSYPVGLGIGSHRRGPDDALVTIVEFSDFDCGYCRRVHATLEALLAKYGRDLRLVYRHYPLVADGGRTKLVAEAAVAAGEEGAFWKFHELVFAHPGRPGRADLIRIARELELDLERFKRALDTRQHAAAVAKDAAAAARLGVRGTPTFFINGRALVGALPLESFEKLVQLELEIAREMVRRGVQREHIYERATSATK